VAEIHDDNEASPSGLITQCLQDWRKGDEDALGRLTTEVYRELRRLAGAVLSGQSEQLTIQPTALVHELYFHLPGVQHFDWECRAQFLNASAKMMRNILVDHARKRRAAKRGGDMKVEMADPPMNDPALQVDVLAVNQALERMAEQYPRHARIVELRFFGGLTVEETAKVLTSTGLQSSQRSVERDWTFARAWLENALGNE
jgi:RNA polymerase sigma factor (TIGR02999 family)